MAERKLVHLSMIVPFADSFEFMTLAENKALAGSFQMKPVRHGGENQKGELQPAPNTDEFVAEWLLDKADIKTKEIMPLADKAGISRTSVYAAIKKLSDKKIIKRIDAGVYVPMVKRGRPPAPEGAPKAARKPTGPRKPMSTPGSGESMTDLLVAEIAKRQNGSGNGVGLGVLKAAMGDKGFVTTGVGPALTQLVAKNRLVRVGVGEYRTPPETPAPEASAVTTSTEAMAEG
jgi:hypothetical protein